MDKVVSLFILQLIVLSAVAKADTEGMIPDEEVPDFFKISAENISEMMAQQLMNTFKKENGSVRMKRAEENGETIPRPEFHSSTLRAQASGSAIPSPTMFVGGFSFMMMPTPEGETIFNRIMEAIPNMPSGGK